MDLSERLAQQLADKIASIDLYKCDQPHTKKLVDSVRPFEDVKVEVQNCKDDLTSLGKLVNIHGGLLRSLQFNRDHLRTLAEAWAERIKDAEIRKGMAETIELCKTRALQYSKLHRECSLAVSQQHKTFFYVFEEFCQREVSEVNGLEELQKRCAFWQLRLNQTKMDSPKTDKDKDRITTISRRLEVFKEAIQNFQKK